MKIELFRTRNEDTSVKLILYFIMVILRLDGSVNLSVSHFTTNRQDISIQIIIH